MGSNDELSDGRRKLLVGYLAAARKRANWSGIDKDTVIAYAIKQLKQIDGEDCPSFDELAVLQREVEKTA
jgi:hypothetical protein